MFLRPDVPVKLKFQFLIGRLKTVVAKRRIYAGCEFQFLIGRLKTHMKGGKMKREFSFNSL